MDETPPAVSLLDLNQDVLCYICGYLDIASQSALSQTCQSMRDKLYHPMFSWKEAVFICNDLLNQETVNSLRQRRVTTIKLHVVASNLIPPLETCLKIETLKSLIVHIEVDAAESNLDLRSNQQTVEESGCPDELQSLYVLAYPGFSFLSTPISKDVESETHCKIYKRLITKVRNISIINIHSYMQHPLAKDIFEMALHMLPMLTDFEHRIFSHYTNKSCTRLDTLSASESPVAAALSHIQRLAIEGLDLPLVSISNKLPELLHLKMCRLPKVLSNDDVTAAKINSIQSFSLRCNVGLYMHHNPAFTVKEKNVHFWREMSVGLGYFPCLQALDLSLLRGEPPEYSNLVSIAQSCPSISVLLLNLNRNLTEKVFTEIITHFKNLEVLMLTLRETSIHWGHAALCRMIKLIPPKLKSIIGLPSLADLLEDCEQRTLVYLSPQLMFYTRSVLRRTSQSLPTTWQTVKKYSDDYYEAFGTRFFYTLQSFQTLKRMEQQQLMDVSHLDLEYY